MSSFAEVINKVLEKDWKAVTEASLSRLYSHAQDGSFAIVSGWRSSQPQEENAKADAAIRQEIRSLGLGYIELEGHWEEKEPEPLYCVFGLTKDQALRIRATYDQDAVIYREGGPDDQVLLLRVGGRTDCLEEPAPLGLELPRFGGRLTTWGHTRGWEGELEPCRGSSSPSVPRK